MSQLEPIVVIVLLVTALTLAIVAVMPRPHVALETRQVSVGRIFIDGKYTQTGMAD